tara:strand:- start:353 stop:646 length:294 start_codon:yes stop_codon:yes gene_type:complete
MTYEERLDNMIADSEAFEQRYYAEHFGDRYVHEVIGRDCSIATMYPEYEDENGERVEERRRLDRKGCADIDLGREYHVPPWMDAIEFRNLLMSEYYA